MSTGWPSMASKLDRLFEAHQQTKGPRHLAQARVWNGDATADARGAELITLLDLVGHRFRPTE